MKKFFALALLTMTSMAHADNVIVNGTRFIYPSTSKEITVRLNNINSRPAMIQSWLDTGTVEQAPETISTPFTITPSITRIEANQGQTLRIKAMNTSSLPKDRESIWYLNVLEIPPKPTKELARGDNLLQMAIRSRFKFIYRPVNLGDRVSATQRLGIKAKGKHIDIENPTPFYISINNISKANKTKIYAEPVLLEPKSHKTIAVTSSVSSNEKLIISDMNDYGATMMTEIITK